MANTVFQLRRNTVSGTRPTTSTVSSGELAINTTDGILFSANATAVFEIGGNLTSTAVGNTTTRSVINATGIYVGNTTTNVVIANTVSSFGGNVSITGVANVTGNVTLGSSAFFVGNGVNITTVNATSITTGTLPDARLSSAVVNTSGAFTISGVHTHSANIDITNDKNLRFQTVNTSAYVGFRQQSDDNFVFYSSNTTGGQRAIFATYANSDSSNFNVVAPLQVSTSLVANNSNGTAGQVLTSSGTGVYWSTVSAAGSVNTAAQFTWSNLHTFSANVSFTGNGIGITTNTGAIYFNSLTDANWRIGRSTGATTKLFYTNNSLDIIAANSPLEGIAFGFTGNSYLETGYAGTFTRLSVYVGNTTINTAISQSAITIANATTTTTLGLTDIRIGSTTGNVIIANTVSTFGGNVSITGVANVAGNVTLGSSAFFVGNGVYLTTVNATSVSTGTLPMAQLGANVVNTSAAFTITGVHTHNANISIGTTTVNAQFTNSSIIINNSNTATLNASSISFGNSTANAIYGITATIGSNTAAVTPLTCYSGSVAAIKGQSNTHYGVYGISNTNYGVYGISTSGVGTYGQSSTNIGTWGQSNTNIGVYGISNTSYGVFGISTSGVGILAQSYTSYPLYCSNNTSTVAYLTNSGDLYATNHYQTSDASLKENIESLKSMGSIVDAIEPKSYFFKPTGEDDIGFLAQDVQKYLPTAVSSRDEDSILAMKISPLVAALWQALRETREELRETREELRETREELSLLKNRVSILEGRPV